MTTENWRMLAHLQVGIIHIRWGRPKKDLIDRGKDHVPIDIYCSIFNDIPPIRQLEWWAFQAGHWHLNNGHWLIQTQAWAISAEDWNVAFFQWSIAWCVCKEISVRKFWGFLHSRNASFNGGGTMWRSHRINSYTTKARLLWIEGYFRWIFIFVGIEQIVYFPTVKMSWKEK